MELLVGVDGDHVRIGDSVLSFLVDDPESSPHRTAVELGNAALGAAPPGLYHDEAFYGLDAQRVLAGGGLARLYSSCGSSLAVSASNWLASRAVAVK